jgi:hypothetical protein
MFPHWPIEYCSKEEDVEENYLDKSEEQKMEVQT